MSTDPQQVYNLFFHPDEVVEIRVIGLSGKSKAWEGWARGDQGIIGYFDNAKDFGAAASSLDRHNHGGIFFTLNPPDPAVLARSKNKMVAGSKQRPGTSDTNIRCIRWLYVDIDAQPLSGISSTAEELLSAYGKAQEISKWLTGEFKYPRPIGGMSGNGYHLLYRLPDLPNEESISARDGLVAQALAALAERFNDTPPVHVDKGVFNASRICKVYGTMARKGDSTEDRPHRQSVLYESCPKFLDDVTAISKKQLKSLADLAPAKSTPVKKKRQTSPKKKKTTTKRGKQSKMPKEHFDPGKLYVEDYLQRYNIDLHSVESKGTQTYYILANCVFDSSHMAKDAAIVMDDDGTLRYTCFHNSCQGRRWSDAREIISGGDSLISFCENYDPDLKAAPKSLGTGRLHDIKIVPECPIVGNNGTESPGKFPVEEFFEERGSRDVFVPMLMAKYLALFLSPIVCTSGVYWRYQNGVWAEMNEKVIKNVAITALDNLSQVSYVNNAVELLSAMINREEKQWPEHPNIINVANGVIDLTEIQQMDAREIDMKHLLKPHDPAYGMRTQLDASFDPDADCNEWIRCLWDIFPEGRDDKKYCAGDEKMSLVQQYGGYVVMPFTQYHKCIFFTGAGSNGKSTIIDAFINVVGKDNHLELSIDELGKGFNIPYLQDKILITAAELSSREPVGIQNLKKCVSGDPVSGERKFGERVQFRNRAKFIFAMNSTPVINDRSYGFSRRVLSLSFTRRFEKTEIDHYIDEKLAKEREGIFLWMLQGSISLLQNRGFAQSPMILQERAEVMSRLNTFRMFLEECCDQGAPKLYMIPCLSLYKTYAQWAAGSGLQAVGRPRFYEQVASSCPAVVKTRTRMKDGSKPYCFHGLGLKEEVIHHDPA